MHKTIRKRPLSSLWSVNLNKLDKGNGAMRSLQIRRRQILTRVHQDILSSSLTPLRFPVESRSRGRAMGTPCSYSNSWMVSALSLFNNRITTRVNRFFSLERDQFLPFLFTPRSKRRDCDSTCNWIGPWHESESSSEHKSFGYNPNNNFRRTFFRLVVIKFQTAVPF